MKPQLLLVADTSFPKVDGILRFMEEFISQASDTFSISLLVPRLGEQRGYLPTTFLTPWKGISLSGYPTIALSWKNLRKIKEAVAKADIIFIQGPALLSYLAMYYGKKMKKKTVAYLHVISWELFSKFLPKALHRITYAVIKKISLFFYNHCTRILVPYAGLAHQLQEEGIRIPIQVAQLGVDIHRFVPSPHPKVSKENIGIPADAFVIGYVGRISREKNTEILIKAFHRMTHKEKVVLLMVGDGLPAQTKSCQELNNCRITGFVTEVEKYLQAMDVFVMPSLTETTSLSTLEAMAAGLPVVATKVGFLQEYLKKEENGLFFPKNNAAHLALKLDLLRRKKEFRLRLGINARKTVVSSFSWEQSIGRMKQCLLSD